MSTLKHYEEAFDSVGWFIPPYVTMGYLSFLTQSIHKNHGVFSQNDLQIFLALIYSPVNLSAMVSERYPIVPYIKEYKGIIAEAVEAHFLGLNHAAATSIIPVIEGVGKKLADSRNVSYKSINSVFINLADDCKDEVKQKNMGAVGEIISMMDSFILFTKKHLYVNSKEYPLTDKTNRHGILHGAYSDHDYGEPINFYKSIAVIDFLCFISSFRASISWMAPSETKESKLLFAHYRKCIIFNGER